jgi:hypothetical protein
LAGKTGEDNIPETALHERSGNASIRGKLIVATKRRLKPTSLI